MRENDENIPRTEPLPRKALVIEDFKGVRRTREGGTGDGLIRVLLLLLNPSPCFSSPLSCSGYPPPWVVVLGCISAVKKV